LISLFVFFPKGLPYFLTFKIISLLTRVSLPCWLSRARASRTPALTPTLTGQLISHASHKEHDHTKSSRTFSLINKHLPLGLTVSSSKARKTGQLFLQTPQCEQELTGFTEYPTSTFFLLFLRLPNNFSNNTSRSPYRD